MKMPIHKLLF